MKIEIPLTLYPDLMEEISELREADREVHNNTVEFDRTALGKLYSLLGQVPKSHRTAHKSTTGAKANRDKVKNKLR